MVLDLDLVLDPILDLVLDLDQVQDEVLDLGRVGSRRRAGRAVWIEARGMVADPVSNDGQALRMHASCRKIHSFCVQGKVNGHGRFGRKMNLKTVAIVASGLISGGVLATGSYWYASPYLAVNSIREAIQQKDGSRFNQYVDYPQLREDLKAYVVTSLTQAATEESLDDVEEGLAALGTALVIPIANTLIDSYLTSEVVKGLIESSEGDAPRAQQTSSNPFSVPDIQAEIAKGKHSIQKAFETAFCIVFNE